MILLIGVPVGAAAGYFGGWVDTLLSRAVDVLYSFPDLLLIIIVVTSLRAALRADAGGLLGLLAPSTPRWPGCSASSCRWRWSPG